MNTVAYRYDKASDEGMKLVPVGIHAPNPLRTCRCAPFHKLKVGDSLFFHVFEMMECDIRSARNSAKHYNRLYNNLFGFVKHRNDKGEYYMLEIVRIK
jgi:hypothetical protein